MLHFIEDEEYDQWEECVKKALYDDRLPLSSKKDLIRAVVESSISEFNNQYATKLRWLELIGGKKNYELRRELEGTFFAIYNS